MNYEKNECEICMKPLKAGLYKSGCEQCGRFFGPCCNSGDGDLCIACYEVSK